MIYIKDVHVGKNSCVTIPDYGIRNVKLDELR